MGKFGEKFRSLIGIDEVDEEDDEELEETKSEYKSIIPPENKASSDIRPASGFAPQPKTENPAAKVENKTLSSRRSTVDVKMIVIDPKSLNDCPRLVDDLKAKKPVIINLENLETGEARKIFDFMSGATYALDGTIQKIANNIFVFAPNNIDIANQNLKASEKEINPWK